MWYAPKSRQHLDDVQPDAAAADDHRGLAGGEVRAVLHGVVCGGDAAADDAGLFQPHALRQVEDHVPRDRQQLREPADVPAGDGAPVQPAERHAGRSPVAEVRQPG